MLGPQASSPAGYHQRSCRVHSRCPCLLVYHQRSCRVHSRRGRLRSQHQGSLLSHGSTKGLPINHEKFQTSHRPRRSSRSCQRRHGSDHSKAIPKANRTDRVWRISFLRLALLARWSSKLKLHSESSSLSGRVNPCRC